MPLSRYESEHDFGKARESYEEAAKYFHAEGSPSHATPCLVKVAQFSIQMQEYAKAIETYEHLSNKALASPALRWNVTEYLFSATLCHLLMGDAVASEAALSKYKEMDVQFTDSRESKMLSRVLASMADGDVQVPCSRIVGPV